MFIGKKPASPHSVHSQPQCVESLSEVALLIFSTKKRKKHRPPPQSVHDWHLKMPVQLGLMSLQKFRPIVWLLHSPSRGHGLRTLRESFFQKSETFGLGLTFLAEIFWGIWGIFGQTITTILALWVPCAWENVPGSFSYKKLWFSGLKHITPKYDIGRQNMLRPYLKIWEWERIFGRSVKAISSPGVRSPCVH